MDEVGVGYEVAAGAVGAAADLDLGDDAARAGDREHRAAAQGLADRRGHVGVLARVDVGGQLRERIRVAEQALEGPGELGRGGLVAGDEQGHQLVAKLDVRHRRAIFVAGEEQHREDVVAVAGIRAAFVDQALDLLVGLLAHREEVADRGEQAAEPLQRRDQADRAHRELGHLADQDPQPLESLAAIEAEDRAQDHLEGELLHVGMERDRAAGRPALDLGSGDVGHEAAQRLHLLAVEGRQHQLPLGQMAILVEQEDRVRPDHGEQDRAALAGVENIRRRREDRLDVLGAGHHHERVDAEQIECERLAVARPATLEIRDRTRLPGKRLPGARRARPLR